MTEKIAILGASRGLGYSLFQHICVNNSEAILFLSSRRIKQTLKSSAESLSNTKSTLDHVKKSLNSVNKVFTYEADFSKLDQIDFLFKELLLFQPTHIVYAAGGGPFGFFEQQKWASHEWAMNVNYIAPAKLLHLFLSHQKQSTLKSFTCVGSAIAEAKPDPRASSYCAAKHALKGLIQTLQAEGQSPFAVKLFSPGYMKTSMLPENSEPVQKGLALDPDSVAAQLFSFIKSKDLMYTHQYE